MIKGIIIAIFSLSTLAYSKYNVEIFCQDINVLLQRVKVHTQNIENHQTTRTERGGHYKRKLLSKCEKGFCTFKTDHSSPILKYMPTHPDANFEGYVAYPSFSLKEEREHLKRAQRAYELVMKTMPVSKEQLIMGDHFQDCFKKYSYFKNEFDFKSYLGRTKRL